MDGQLSCVNWPAEYPDRPLVSFSFEKEAERLRLRWEVRENASIARARADNDRVWEDSCCEMFIRFEGEEEYYNLEASCNGRILLGWRRSREDCTHAPEAVLKSIVRKGSLPLGVTFSERHLPVLGDGPSWTLELEIPVSAFWKSGLKSFDGVHAFGNFYKCGDALSRPHYVSWAPIQTPAPDYHRPEFFKELF